MIDKIKSQTTPIEGIQEDLEIVVQWRLSTYFCLAAILLQQSHSFWQWNRQRGRLTNGRGFKGKISHTTLRRRAVTSRLTGGLGHDLTEGAR